MLYSNATGRLGSDPKTEQLPNGRILKSFTMATDDYEKGTNVPLWITASVFNDSLFKKVDSLKKGSLISVQGIAKPFAYMSIKDNTPKSGIRMIINSIEFIHSARSEAQKETEPSTITCGSVEEIEKMSEAKGVPVTLSGNNVDGDDLPF